MEPAKKFVEENSEVQEKVLVQIHFRSHVVDIHEFSEFQAEKEFLILPGRHMKVAAISEENEWTVIQITDEKCLSMLPGVTIPKWETAAPPKEAPEEEKEKERNTHIVEKKIEKRTPEKRKEEKKRRKGEKKRKEEGKVSQ
eukprot:TRINITY_DN5258_c0_g5_i1.p2 TRINITY_DN5258_c0_g5~~TRINITY_DN5258_c0_g5_i1.p2  ORF type:complete len:141 (+),score=56.08 TRINITY_DN5258_c0_g5_i1:430-852(+)